MLEFNDLPETIRIKYCFKGDKHYRLYNCLKENLNYNKISQLLVENNQKFFVKLFISSSKLKEEIMISSDDEFRRFVFSNLFFNYYDSNYNCLKIQFVKENLSDDKTLEKDLKFKDFISERNTSVTFDYSILQFLKDGNGKKELISFLHDKKILPFNLEMRNTEVLIEKLLHNIKENYDNFVKSKALLGNLKLDVNLQNLEENNLNQDFLNFSSMYNIEEMNLISNEEIIRDSTVFRTKKFSVIN